MDHAGRKYFTSDVCNIIRRESLVHVPIQSTDRLASMIYVLYRLGKRETAVRDHSRRFENDSAFLPSPRLDFNDSFATKRDTGWPSFRDEYEEEVEVVYQRNGFRFFSSRGSLCSNEPRRFTGRRVAEIASFSFLFPLFLDDHFPRESSYPPFLWHVFSNTSIGKTEISAIWRRYVLFLSGEETSFRPPFSSIAARFVNSH